MTITILHINTQGIQQKLPSIKNLIHIHNPDFISIQETFLKINNNTKITIPGYSVKDYRRPVKSRGGIILAYKESIKHSKTQKTTTNKGNEFIKSDFVISNRPLTIVSLYNPSHERIDTQTIDTILTDSSVIVGDLNCRHTSWGDTSSNLGGRHLFDFVITSNINTTFHTEITHIHQAPPYTESKIDIALWRSNHRYIRNITPFALDDIGSDHFPILFKLDSNLSKPKSTKKIPLYQNYDWTKANEKISNIITQDLTIDGIDSILKNLETIVTDIINEIPHKTIYTSNQGLSKEIRDKLTEKKNLSKTWKKYHNPRDKRLLNKLNKDIKDMIKTSESQKTRKHINNIESKNSSKYWKSFDHLFRKRKAQTISQIKDPNTGIMETDDLKIANIFKETQSKIFEGNPILNHEHENLVNNWYNRYRCPLFPTEIFFEKAEISKKFKKLKNRKAPGPDGMNNVILKYLEPSLRDLLYKIYNSCYNLGYFPKAWKIAMIKMLHKKDDKSDPLNYRPISLLNQLGKIFESLITDIIYFWAEDENKIDINQAGFRKKRSTNDQLYNLMQFAIENFNRKNQVDCIFIDFEKAFDKVWHKGLLYKLKALKLPDKHIQMVKSFLSDRQCFISNGNSKSGYFSPESGVPQGSCLSPLLFILFVVDIPTNPKVKQSKFADDLALFAHILSKSKRIIKPNPNLQSLLNELMTWCRKWRMKINLKKTKKLNLTRCHHSIVNTIYHLDNRPIEIVQKIKFLGITLDYRLNLNEHIDNKISQAFTKIHLLINMNHNNISITSKRRVYITLIRSIIEYGSSMLCAINKTNTTKLELFQNKCMRIITNSRRSTKITDLYALSNITPIKSRILDLAKKWFTQAKANPKNNVSFIREAHFPNFDTHLSPFVAITFDLH